MGTKGAWSFAKSLHIVANVMRGYCSQRWQDHKRECVKKERAWEAEAGDEQRTWKAEKKGKSINMYIYSEYDSPCNHTTMPSGEMRGPTAELSKLFHCVPAPLNRPYQTLIAPGDSTHSIFCQSVLPHAGF